MDPNALLEKLRFLARRLSQQAEGDVVSFDEGEILDFCDGFMNLDNWIMSKGFLPTDWNNGKS